jgi:hypothetical protein
MPLDDRHPMNQQFGSVQSPQEGSHCDAAAPEQHSFGVNSVDPAPRHVHVPVVQMPETQSAFVAQGPPLVPPQVPWTHSVEVQSSFAVHGDPSGSFAAQAPALHQPDEQSPSTLHVAPFAPSPQVPPPQAPLRHAAAFVQGWPSGRPHSAW